MWTAASARSPEPTGRDRCEHRAVVFAGSWPVRLSFLYPHPGALPVWQWSGALLILSAITYAALRFAKERPYLAVGWLWYLGTLFPVSGLIVIGPHAMADRYTYVPLIGLYEISIIAAGLVETKPVEEEETEEEAKSDA